MSTPATVTTHTSLPIRASAVKWRKASGEWCLTVLAKTTFLLRSARCPCATTQQAIFSRARYYSDDGDSIYAPADEVPVKPRIDVLLVGHAFAPRGTESLQVHARLKLGSIDKQLEVSCDRWWKGAAINLGASFSRMPLRYEFAGVGKDQRNARGIASQEADDGRIHVPNLLSPGTRVERPEQQYEPVGFGPIPAHWPERLDRLRTRLGRPSVVAWRNRPLPENLDLSYFNVAPADQQLDSLPRDAELVLENLSRDTPRLVTKVPQPNLLASVSYADQQQELSLKIDTLWIDTDTDSLVIVWRQHCDLAANSAEHEDPVSVKIFEPNEQTRDSLHAFISTPGDAKMPAPERQQFSKIGALKIDPSSGLPFANIEPQGAAQHDDDALPFRAAGTSPPAPLAEQPPALAEPPAQVAQHPHGASTSLGVPHAPAPPLTPPVAAVTPIATPVHVEAPARVVTPHSLIGPSPPPPARLAPLAGSAPPTSVSAGTPDAEIATPATETPAITNHSAAPTNDAPAEPLANTDSEPASQRAGSTESASSAKREASAEPSEPVPLPLADFDLEKCAELDASLDYAPQQQTQLLEQQELSLSLWKRLRDHWQQMVREANQRGDHSLLKRQDQAYLQRLEELRGALTAEDYAHLKVALERGNQPTAAADLKVPLAAIMPIERQWLIRSLADKALAERTRSAIRVARTPQKTAPNPTPANGTPANAAISTQPEAS